MSTLHKMNELLSLYRAEDSHASSGAQVEAVNYKNVILGEDLQNPYLYWRRSMLSPHEHHSTKNPVSEATLRMSTSDNACLFWILLPEKHQTILICWNHFRGNKYSSMQNNFCLHCWLKSNIDFYEIYITTNNSFRDIYSIFNSMNNKSRKLYHEILSSKI